MLLPFGLILAGVTTAIDCSAKELKPYNFESISGVLSVETIRDTPPSETNITWYFGICKNTDEIEQCPKNSDVCGITTVSADDKKLVSEIVGFNSNLQKKYEANDDGVVILYSGANWGSNLVDAKLTFICDKEKDNEVTLDGWDGKLLEATVRSNAACITNDKDKKKKPAQPKHPNENGELWGWFTWIFIFMVLFLSIYIVGGAWFQYNKGNSIDFQTALREVLDNFVDLLRGLPAFVREIVEKITGNGNRGEYSAV